MARIDRETSGVFIIAATPFTETGALDLESVDTLVEAYLASGVNGMTILGMMGEAPKLTDDEARTLVKRFLGRVPDGFPVVVGVSAAGFAPLSDLAGFAMDAGAAGVMAAPPRGLGTETQVTAWMDGLCRAVGPETPICFQDYPQATGVPVSADTILSLTREHPQVVMLKHEDCPGLAKLSTVRRLSGTAETPRLSILCGNGGLYLPQEMARGADGAMTGFAYPEMLVGVVQRVQAGDPDGAEDWFDAWLPLVKHEQQPGFGLALRKETLRRRGAIRSAATRAPGPRLSGDDLAELERLIARTEARVAALDGERT